MHAPDPELARQFLETPLQFEVGRMSWPQEIASFSRALRNYSEEGLASHLRLGFAFRVRLPRPGLVLSHPRHLYRTLRSHVLNYPKNPDYEHLRPLLGDGIFVSDGDHWSRQRRLLSPEFKPKAVHRFLPVLVDAIEALFAEWDRAGDAILDLTVDMMRLTIWGVGSTLFDSDFRAEAERIGRALEVCLDQATLRLMSMGLLRPWIPTPGNLKANAAERELDTLVRDLIARVRGGDAGGHMLPRLLAAKDETGAGMTDQQLLDEVKSMIVAGHETTSLALSWAFYLLSRHPEAEARLVEEASRVLGGRRPTVDDVPKLEYTRMVLLETMRLYPPVPGVPRIAREADSFDGIDVAAGENVVINIYTTHRHPELWPDPETFDPERFSAARADSILPYSYLPFLFGRRVCLGEHFAMLEATLALAMIADRYRVERVDTDPIGTRPISTLRLARPLRVRVRRR
jgi:cytochrome P450